MFVLVVGVVGFLASFLLFGIFFYILESVILVWSKFFLFGVSYRLLTLESVILVWSKLS